MQNMISIALGPSTVSLLKTAAQISQAFGVPDNDIQPEFLLAAVFHTKPSSCEKFTDIVASIFPDLSDSFLLCLCDLYEKAPHEISKKLEDSEEPTVLSYGKNVGDVLISAAIQWDEMGKTATPVPIDFILATMFSYKRLYLVLDNALLCFDADRVDLLRCLAQTSEYFTEATEEPEEATWLNTQDKNTTVRALAKIEKHLSKTIIGQPHANKAIMRHLKNYYAGLKNPIKPIAVLIFAGFTGTGKTELPKQLAFITDVPILRLDMSEFAADHTVSRLYGSPPGYVGSGEGGQLTNFVKENPSCVIVFDEIEKAHPKLTDILLQIAEEGTLTDGSGNKVVFRDTIVILTSNIGAREAAYTPIGFGTATSNNSKDFMLPLKKHFRPELLGRIGPENIIIFNKLEPADLRKVIDLEFKKLSKRTKMKHGVNLRRAPYTTDMILQTANTDQYGARDIGKTIEQTILPLLSDHILSNVIPVGSTITVSYQKNSGFTLKSS